MFSFLPKNIQKYSKNIKYRKTLEELEEELEEEYEELEIENEFEFLDINEEIMDKSGINRLKSV